MWLISAGFLLLTALVLTRLDVPAELERTDYRALLRRLRESRAEGSSALDRLFGGSVSSADVLGGEVFAVSSAPPERGGDDAVQADQRGAFEPDRLTVVDNDRADN